MSLLYLVNLDTLYPYRNAIRLHADYLTALGTKQEKKTEFGVNFVFFSCFVPDKTKQDFLRLFSISVFVICTTTRTDLSLRVSVNYFNFFQ